MPKFTVKARAPTLPQDYGGFPPCVNVAMNKFNHEPVFEVSFPDLDPSELLELSVYLSAVAYIARQLHYPHHLSNFLSAFADAMKAITNKYEHGGCTL